MLYAARLWLACLRITIFSQSCENRLPVTIQEALTHSLYPVSWCWGQLHARTFALMKLSQTESSRFKKEDLFKAEILSLLFFFCDFDVPRLTEVDGCPPSADTELSGRDPTASPHFEDQSLSKRLSTQQCHGGFPFERWVESTSWFWLKTPDELSESTSSRENAATELSARGKKKDNGVQADNCYAALSSHSDYSPVMGGVIPRLLRTLADLHSGRIAVLNERRLLLFLRSTGGRRRENTSPFLLPNEIKSKKKNTTQISGAAWYFVSDSSNCPPLPDVRHKTALWGLITQHRLFLAPASVFLFCCCFFAGLHFCVLTKTRSRLEMGGRFNEGSENNCHRLCN